MDEQFNFKIKYRYLLVILTAMGILASIGFIVGTKPDASRIWANVLLNNQFFLGISLGASFFLAVHIIAQSGWHTVLQRLPEAMATFIPVAFALMLAVYFGMDKIYHWVDHEGYDVILEGKKSWLNVPFFFIRMIIYFTGWIVLTSWMRKTTRQLMSAADIKSLNRRKIFAGLFLVFYAITVSTSSWDWIMSLDPHWFSTIFGWYVFISMFVTALAFLIMLAWFLKRAGYMKSLRTEHVNDLGVLLFSFSIFWTYLWFSQYELIWYGHLPEETSYYITRLRHFRLFFFINLGINFIVPFFGLIMRSSRIRINRVAAVAAIVFAGHWIDYWLMIMPAAAGEKAGIGLLEISMTIIYLCLFLYLIFTSLSRGTLIVKNDPFLEESLKYES